MGNPIIANELIQVPRPHPDIISIMGVAPASTSCPTSCPTSYPTLDEFIRVLCIMSIIFPALEINDANKHS
jgi:hypothetical protein